MQMSSYTHQKKKRWDNSPKIEESAASYAVSESKTYSSRIRVAQISSPSYRRIRAPYWTKLAPLSTVGIVFPIRQNMLLFFKVSIVLPIGQTRPPL